MALSSGPAEDHASGPRIRINKVKAKLEDYDGFVEKFKPKKTTDDCYTPEPVYRAVLEWVSENIMPLDGVEIVRPFWPGGDYESYDYPPGCVVIDNPPFSIGKKIRDFYHRRGIPYFLFAPGLTLVSGSDTDTFTAIIIKEGIVYDNGACISTGFVTNLDCGGTAIWVAGDLSEKIKRVQRDNKKYKSIPRFRYPPEVVSPAILGKIARNNITLRIPRDECRPLRVLDVQREHKKSIFGGGWLISERMAAERMAAERMAAERMAAPPAYTWTLSEREREIIKSMQETKNIID